MQPIYNIAEICAQHGVEHAVLSPGSRVAPLTLAFTHHPKITCKTISDERSAAYIALGIAQQTQKPVVIACTSGTAALNYYPAIAEAFYQKIPLIVLTADRPPEWIDQQDGQAIRQNNVYHNHIKKSWSLPTEYEHPDTIWQIERSISEALIISQQGVKGPVHVNVPFREPFYPEAGSEITYSDVKVIREFPTERVISKAQKENIQKIVDASPKVLVVAGQHKKDPKLEQLLSKLQLPIISDTIANYRGENAINHHDLFLGNLENKEELITDLLITYGDSILAKNAKLFLRKNKPKHHLHISEGGEVIDTYQSLTEIVNCSASYFFESIHLSQHDIYLANWKKYDEQTESLLNSFFEDKSFSEFEACQLFLKQLPENSVLHLANSMPVRYVNFIQAGASVEIQANRGTSGIDGSLSTAVGSAIADSKRQHTVLLGDMSFFYDRNALWNNYYPDNLNIVVLNNHGGGIFRMIPGSKKTKQLEEYFVTDQKQSAEATAKDHGLTYLKANSKAEAIDAIQQLMNSQKTLLEIETDGQQNTELLDQFKKELKDQLLTKNH